MRRSFQIMALSLLASTLSQVTFGQGGSSDECAKAASELAREKALALGRGPSAKQESYDPPRVVRNPDGTFTVLVPRSMGQSSVTLYYKPVDPTDPGKGFTVQRRIDDTGEITETFSARPPVSAALIAEQNALRQLAENGKKDLIQRYLGFHTISPERFAECRSLVLEKKPDLSGNDLNVLAASYAVATSPQAINNVLAGAKFRGHGREQVRRLIAGAETDDDTVQNEVHQAYADTVGALRTLLKAGFSDVVQPTLKESVEKLAP